MQHFHKFLVAIMAGKQSKNKLTTPNCHSAAAASIKSAQRHLARVRRFTNTHTHMDKLRVPQTPAYTELSPRLHVHNKYNRMYVCVTVLE